MVQRVDFYGTYSRFTEGVQRFFQAVHELTSQKRLSRFAYVVEKRG